MSQASSGADFLGRVPSFQSFTDIANTDAYVPLPDNWVLGCADVVSSTQAIQAGRYKTVNMAGAAVISAVSNEVGHQSFPYVFGGDGASFAVPPEWAEQARKALAATATFVREEFELELRVGAIPVSEARKVGLDVRLAQFAASPNVSYAMFTGGGLAWADAELKAGRYAVAPAPAGTRPNLTGLSCRFDEIPAQRGVILSIIVQPTPASDPGRYKHVIEDILDLVEDAQEGGRPLPAGGPTFKWPASGIGLEARIIKGSGSELWAKLRLLAFSAMSSLIFRLGRPLRGFDPTLYMADLVANSDYRKYDDGLRMTIDSRPDLADRIEARLEAAAQSGDAQYGLHRQGAALMTCITPSVLQRDHVHFIDGAAGGYAAAATNLKASA